MNTKQDNLNDKNAVSNGDKAFSAHYDVRGLSINRVVKQAFLTKFFPIGNNISGKIRARDALNMFIEHKFGQKIAYFTTKYEKQVHQMRNLQFKMQFNIRKVIDKIKR